MATFLAMRRHMTALLVAGLLLGACGDDDDSGERAAVTSIPDDTTTSSTTTTEPSTVAPDVIPRDESQITEEYVEQVLNELFAVSGDALRASIEAGLVDETAIALVEATSSPSTVDEDINELLSLAEIDFEGVRDDVTSLRATVLDLVTATSECIFVEIELDRSGVVAGQTEPDPNVRTFVRLLPATSEQRASGHNPTAWVTDGLPTSTDGSAAEPGCPA